MDEAVLRIGDGSLSEIFVGFNGSTLAFHGSGSSLLRGVLSGLELLLSALEMAFSKVVLLVKGSDLTGSFLGASDSGFSGTFGLSDRSGESGLVL